MFHFISDVPGSRFTFLSCVFFFRFLSALHAPGDAAGGVALRAGKQGRTPHVQGRGFQRDEGRLLVPGFSARPHLPAGDESYLDVSF